MINSTTTTQITPEDREKRIYKYINLHKSLAKDYSTTIQIIGYIRGLAIGKNLTQKQVIRETEGKMFKSKKNRNHSVAWYLKTNSFIKKLNKDDWIEITEELHSQGGHK